MDEKIAMGMARDDARRLSRSVEGKMQEFASAVVGTVSARFRLGRRLSGEDLRRLIADTDRIVGEQMVPVARVGHHRPATRTRPKGEAFERLSLHVMPKQRASGQAFEIWAFRMVVGARKVVFDTMHTGLQFHLHTVQRVLQRYEDRPDSWREPVKATAREMLANAGRMYAALEASKARDCDVSLRMAVGPGMLAGTIEREPIPAGEPLFRRTCLDLEAGISRDLPHPYLPGETEVRKITMRTYVPGELMRPSQAAFTDLWDDLRYDHPAIEQSVVDYFWPTRQLWQPEARPEPEAVAAGRAAVASLVFDPQHWNDGSKRTKFYTPRRVESVEPEMAMAPAM
jgi:hypothetical protein